jgi:hypothetical protein
VYAGFYVGESMGIEPRLGFFRMSDGDDSLTFLTGMLNVNYFTSGWRVNSPYLFLSSGVVDMDGDQTNWALGAGAGYRFIIRDVLSLRLQAAFHRWFADDEFDEDTNAISLRVVFGTIIPGN